MVEGGRADGLVIVAEANLARTLRRGERAETLAGLRGRLRKALSNDVELADPVTVRLALARVAPGVVADDPWLGPIARRGGRAWLRLVDAMDEAVGALQSQREALAVVARGTDAVAMRARLLARLEAALERALGHLGLVDPRRDAELLADRVAHADTDTVLDAVSASSLLARGIVEWTPKDLALWRVLDASLSRSGGRASIELPVFDRPLDGERQPDPLDTLIEAVAAALDDAPLTESLSPSLGDLRLGSQAAPEVRVPTELRRADGAEAQGRAVADAVHAALADGATPDDVLVGLVGDDETSALAVLRALEALQIPAVDTRAMRASRSNLLALAQAALDVAADGAPRAEVARLLRSSYVDARRVTGEADAATAKRVVRTLARCLEETTTVKGNAPGEHLAATVATASRVDPADRAQMIDSATQVGALLQRVSAGSNRAELARGVRELYRGLGLDGVAAEPAASHAARAGGIDAADADARRRDAEAWATLQGVLGGYERAVARLGLATVHADLESFRHEIAWALARSSTPERASRGVVRVARFAELPTEPCALVALADVQAWPDGRPHARLIPGALEERIRRASDPAIQPIALAGAAEALARLALTTSCARRVVVAYRTHDHDGAALTVSSIVGWLGRSVPATSWRPTTPLHRPLTERERRLATLAQSPARATREAPSAARRATLERRREQAFGLTLPPDHPLVATLPRGDAFRTILTEESGGADRPLPASAVDTLASCVFQGFVTQVLRPKRASEAHDIADAREEGILTHAALEAAFRATEALWSQRPRDHETILRVGIAGADRLLEASPLASPLVRSVVARARAGVRAVLEWSIADEAWDFAAAEQPFGERGGWAGLSLDRPGTHVTMRGRIDRVDVAHEGSAVRVIDYKTRATSAENHTARFGVTAFQLALYARVAKDALQRATAAGIYLTTQRLRPGDTPKKSVERWTTAHEIEEGMERFEQAVLDRVDELRSGRVDVRPYDDKACAHCAYEGVCRKPRFAPSQPDDDDASEDDDS
jgi:hypothetical protein